MAEPAYPSSTGARRKPWWKSKTLGTSIAIAVAGVVVPQALPGTVIDPDQGVAAAVTSVIFGVLRLLSNSKLVA